MSVFDELDALAYKQMLEREHVVVKRVRAMELRLREEEQKKQSSPKVIDIKTRLAYTQPK